MVNFLTPLRHARKGLLLILPLFLIAGYSLHEANGHFLGISGQSTAGCGGSGCHSAFFSSSTWVQILPPNGPIQVGKTYTFSFLVWDELSQDSAAGCDITCDPGATLDTLPNSGLWFPGAPLFPDLSHKRPKLLVRDSAVWSFLYTAPKKTGNSNIYAAGNAVHYFLDSMNDPQGDSWNKLLYNVTVVPVNGVTSTNIVPEFSLFPNPSIGIVTLSNSGITGAAQIEIADESGKIITTETLIIGNSTPIDVHTIPNGTYFLTLRPRYGKALTERFVIAK